jgi:hypothetical protein
MIDQVIEWGGAIEEPADDQSRLMNVSPDAPIRSVKSRVDFSFSSERDWPRAASQGVEGRIASRRKSEYRK